MFSDKWVAHQRGNRFGQHKKPRTDESHEYVEEGPLSGSGGRENERKQESQGAIPPPPPPPHPYRLQRAEKKFKWGEATSGNEWPDPWSKPAPKDNWTANKWKRGKGFSRQAHQTDEPSENNSEICGFVLEQPAYPRMLCSYQLFLLQANHHTNLQTGRGLDVSQSP